MDKLPQFLQARLKHNNIESLFPVQEVAIPYLLASFNSNVQNDVCICSPTGSGKTLAFALPIITTLHTRQICCVRCVCILPTKDLAKQVADVMVDYTKGTKLRVVSITGDRSFPHEQSQLVATTTVLDKVMYHNLADIVVATPGRFMDHLQLTEGFDLSHLRFLVVDEADQLLDQASDKDWISSVITSLPQHSASRIQRQASLCWFQVPGFGQPTVAKLLCSATLNPSHPKLAELQLVNPKFFLMRNIAPKELCALVVVPKSDDEWLGVSHVETLLGGPSVVLSCRQITAKKGKEGALITVQTKDEKEITEKIIQNGFVVTPKREVEGIDSIVQGETKLALYQAQKFTLPASLKEVVLPSDSTVDVPLVLVSLLCAPELSSGSTLIFCNTLENTHRLTRLLQLFGFPAIEYSAKVGRVARARALDQVHRRMLKQHNKKKGEHKEQKGKIHPEVHMSEHKDEKEAYKAAAEASQQKLMNTITEGEWSDDIVAESHIVVCSDALARGMDLNVATVINYDVPTSANTYVHRVGRTARAGGIGTAYTIVPKEQKNQFQRTIRNRIAHTNNMESLQLNDRPVSDEDLEQALQLLRTVLSDENKGMLDKYSPLTGNWMKTYCPAEMTKRWRDMKRMKPDKTAEYDPKAGRGSGSGRGRGPGRGRGRGRSGGNAETELAWENSIAALTRKPFRPETELEGDEQSSTVEQHSDFEEDDVDTVPPQQHGNNHNKRTIPPSVPAAGPAMQPDPLPPQKKKKTILSRKKRA